MAQLLKCLASQACRNVGEHVADLIEGGQDLCVDVGFGGGKNLVDARHDAGDVAVDEAHAVARALANVHRQVRQVDAHVGGSADLVFADLSGHETADVVLGFLRRAADVGREDDVVEGRQGRGERVAVGARLLREHIDGGAAQVT